MKTLLLLFYIILSSINAFSQDSGDSKVEDLEKIQEEYRENPYLFRNSLYNCNAKFVLNWINSINYNDNKTEVAYPLLCEELRRNADINLAFIRENPDIFKLIDPELVLNYDEIAKIVVNYSIKYFEYVQPEALVNKETYYELTTLATRRGFYEYWGFYAYDAPKYLSTKERFGQMEYLFVNAGVSLAFVNPETLSSPEEYDMIAITAVIRDGRNFQHVEPEELSNTKVYDKLAKIAVDHYGAERERVRPGGALEYVKPEYLSSEEKYDEYSRIAVNRDGRNLEYVKPEYLSSKEIYDILRKIPDYDQTVMDKLGKDIGYIEDVSKKVVFSLEETKREDLLNYIESSRCNWAENFKNHLFPSKCKYEEKINKWLREYEDYEKEQEAK
jgi:hypothetical protein